MPQVVTAIDIDAPPEKVWEVLVDVHAWDAWNPLITGVKEPLRAGAPVRGKLHVEGRKVPFDARISVLDEGKELRWVGPLFKPLQFFVRGEHFFEVTALDGGRTRVFHGEALRGIVFDAESVWAKAEPAMTPLYEAFNAALKARVED